MAVKLPIHESSTLFAKQQENKLAKAQMHYTQELVRFTKHKKTTQSTDAKKDQ